MKTHFNINFESDDEEWIEYAWCGTLLGEDPSLTSEWEHVDCKRCLKSKTKIEKAILQIENDINSYCEGFMDFIERNNKQTIQHV